MSPGDLERYGERGVFSSLDVLGATLDELREAIAANRGALAQRDHSPWATWTLEGWVWDHGEGRRSFELHARDFGWLHEVAASLAQRGHQALVIDGTSFRSPHGFRAFTVHAPQVAPKTWWIDPLRGLNSPEAELDDLLLQFRGEGFIAKDEVSEQAQRSGRRELLVRLTRDREQLWPPQFLTVEQHQAEHEARDEPASSPPKKTLRGLLVLLALAPAAIAVPWFWSSVGHVVDVEGALIASSFSALSVGWMALLPFGWVPLKFRVVWFVGVSALIPFWWVLT